MSCTPRYYPPITAPLKATTTTTITLIKTAEVAASHVELHKIALSNVSFVFLRRSGSVCLDVINQTWSPMYDMVNIFEVFLPQLLRYPNPTDPLNGEAAALMMRDAKSYEAKVKGM